MRPIGVTPRAAGQHEYLTANRQRPATGGWDVVRVSDLLPPGATTDEQILSLARAQDRVVVTQDLDFSLLLALGGFDRPSLVTVRLRSAGPRVVTARLLQLLPVIEQALAQGSAITIEDARVRVRRLPIA